MKISFQKTIPDTEKQQAAKARSQELYRYAEEAHGGKSRAGRAGSVNAARTAFAKGTDCMGISGKQSGKGKSLIELQQEAANTDAAVQQDYMTLMSNTMSEEDYAKLQEEGFDFGGLEPEEAVTIVDKIKTELVRSGKQIAGYTDDLDMETLSAALGSQTLAQAVVKSFDEADIPLTRDNLDAVSAAWNMASELQPLEEGSISYLLDNGMKSEIWNLYLAQNSGAKGADSAVPQFYAEEVPGYYTRSAADKAAEGLDAQIDKMLEQSGRELSQENRQRATWLLEKGLPLTEESLDRLEELESLELPVSEEQFAERAAVAVAEGKNPVHADMGGMAESIYEKAVRLDSFYRSDAAWESAAETIAARRQLEEIRLHMTAEVNVKLLKSGFSIDTAPMEELIKKLKSAEAELAENYFPGDAEAVQKYQTYSRTRETVEEIPALPAQVLGTFAEGQATASLEEFHREGKALQQEYTRANESYESLMTAPRRDLGDSIGKAFANVDEILGDLGLELNEENRRAVRILGYNRMEISVENLEEVQKADRQVEAVVERLTPAATLRMIRDGVNPLEKSFEELQQYFDSLPEDYYQEAESYSRFLYGLEKNREITSEERESYIGIYRLVRQIEKTDGAAVGALVNTQAELHFTNLLSVVRSGKFRTLDARVTDELGTLVERIQKGESISEQISRGFADSADRIMTEMSYKDEIQQEYNRNQLEQYRSAVSAADSEVTAMLARGELSAGGDNLLAAEALLHRADNLLERADRRAAERRRGVLAGDAKTAGGVGRSENSSGASESSRALDENGAAAPADSTELWESLDSRDEFIQSYQELTESARAELEEMRAGEAETSVDIRSMQLAHKQLTVMSALAGQEEYFIPLYVDGALTRVHLTFDRNGEERGTVRIGVSSSAGEYMGAQLYMENGKLQGIFSAQTQDEVMKLERVADIFKREASKSWSVGDVSVVGMASGTQKSNSGTVSGEEVESTELYRMAKTFLQAVQKGVVADENKL